MITSVIDMCRKKTDYFYLSTHVDEEIEYCCQKLRKTDNAVTVLREDK